MTVGIDAERVARVVAAVRIDETVGIGSERGAGIRIGNRAVRKAREENHRLGLPNVFTINGKIYYELPNGEITTESPLKD